MELAQRYRRVRRDSLANSYHHGIGEPFPRARPVGLHARRACADQLPEFLSGVGMLADDGDSAGEVSVISNDLDPRHAVDHLAHDRGVLEPVVAEYRHHRVDRIGSARDQQPARGLRVA